MSDSKGTRFSEKEKVILYGLFKKYQNIIDIRHRRYSQHKQAELRKCWDTILETFNASAETNPPRTIKQVQKFFLNAKLRNRLPPHSNTSDATSQSHTKLVKLKPEQTSTDSDNNSVGSKCFEEKYASQLHIGETYQVEYDENNLQGALIVNSDGMSMSSPQSIANTNNPTLATPNTFIINSIEQITPNGLGTSGTLNNTSNMNTIIHTRLEPATRTLPEPEAQINTAFVSGELSRVAAPSEVNAFQRQSEMEYRLRELQLKVETEEIRKEIAREELQQLREIHKLKVREMELRLKNLDRT